MATADHGISYLDASALAKLVRAEPETAALLEHVNHRNLLSSSIVLTELPRAIRRAAAGDPALPLDALIRRASELLDAIALIPVDDRLLAVAGAIAEPALRSLDTIHVAAAAGVGPLDAFVTYDVRQGAAARLAGLPAISPGAVQI